MVLEASRKLLETHNEKQCRKGEEMGAQRESQSELKSIQKGTQNMFFFLWVPLGVQGVPGSLFNGFWHHF